MTSREEWIASVLAKLLPLVPEAGLRALSLDQIGEAIGAEAISADDVEELFACLEREGIAIGDGEAIDLARMLREVIQTALSLRKQGVKPTAQKISERCSLSKEAVRVALLYSEVLRG